MKGREDKNERKKWTGRTLTGRTTEGTEMTGENEWEGVRRLESDRQDYSKSSPSQQSARSSHFSPFHHLWPSQNWKTTNNITTLPECTEPVTTVYVGLITAWSSSSDYQGHRLNALADFGVCLCARPAKIWIWRSCWWKCSVHARDKKNGCSCWPLTVSAHLILSNTKEKNGNTI